MKKLSLATLLAMGTCVAYAGITASPLWITLQPGSNNNSNIANITVNNPDSTTAYVKANIVKLNKIGDPQSSTTPYKLGDNPKKFGLLVSPTKFAIKPGNSITVRVSNLNQNPQTDAQYNIVFTPVSGHANHAQSSQGAGKKKVTLNMNLVVSYKTQVFVIPRNVSFKTCMSKSGNAVSIRNTGNTFIQLLDGKICNAAGKDCKAFSTSNYRMIPAHDNLKVTMPKSGNLVYTVKYGKDQTTEISTAKNAC